MIKKVKQELEIKEVLVDGEFATHAMMDSFAGEGIDFTARIAVNRNVVTEDGLAQQLRNHPALRLRKNEKKPHNQSFIRQAFL